MTILRIKVFRAGKSFLVHRRHEGSRFVGLNVLRPYMAVVCCSVFTFKNSNALQQSCSKAVPWLSNWSGLGSAAHEWSAAKVLRHAATGGPSHRRWCRRWNWSHRAPQSAAQRVHQRHDADEKNEKTQKNTETKWTNFEVQETLHEFACIRELQIHERSLEPSKKSDAALRQEKWLSISSRYSSWDFKR